MNYQIDIQHACDETIPVTDAVLTNWATLALTAHRNCAELTLRLVNSDEMTQLNTCYRQQNKATNVLAFPANIPADVALEYPFLGDVIICPTILKEESIQLNKPLVAHWALIVIHGVLHLLGFDHIDDHDATIMQALEIQLLAELGFDNPYPIEDLEIDQR